MNSKEICKLMDELKKRQEMRIEISNRLSDARSKGDLVSNTAYKEEKAKQDANEARISEIRDIILSATCRSDRSHERGD